MARIVVGVDGSPPSRVALRWSVAEARFRGVTLDVVHTWSPDFTPWTSSMYAGPAGALWVEDVELPPIDNVRHGLLATLEKLLADEGLTESGDPPTTRRIVEGPSGPSLVEAAHGADLLVVGARGFGEIRGLFVGSVSLYCVAHASVPVVVVRGEASDEHDRD